MSSVASDITPDAPPVKRRHVVPGFGLSMGFTISYLSLIVLIPLLGVFMKTASLGWSDFVSAAFSERALATYQVTFSASFVAALINVVFGLILAWVLVRYRFPFQKLVDSLIDLPFALPTAVAGITLTTLYGPTGWIGSHIPAGTFSKMAGLSYSYWGIVVALTFIGLPFVVRTVQPVLEELDAEVEEAAATLGATPLQIIFRVILPELLPSVLAGFAMAFARAVGEYGSVVFIAGNMPMKTEITPLLIIMKLEEYEYADATALATVMLVVSFGLLLIINVIQRWSGRSSTL